MEMKWKYAAIGSMVIILAFVVWIMISISTIQQDYSELADCLSEKGVIMAGTDTCPACKNQKALFGESFEKIDYRNCDLERKWCEARGVTGYPTWFFPDKTQALGVKDAEFLSEAAGCNAK